MSADRPENHLCHFLSDAFGSWFVHAIVPSDDLILSGDTSVHSLCHTHTPPHCLTANPLHQSHPFVGLRMRIWRWRCLFISSAHHDTLQLPHLLHPDWIFAAPHISSVESRVWERKSWVVLSAVRGGDVSLSGASRGSGFVCATGAGEHGSIQRHADRNTESRPHKWQGE